MHPKNHLFLSILLLCSPYHAAESKPFPISFAISETKIVSDIPEKTQDFAFIIPGNLNTYIYENEQDYYQDYQRSFFGITCKKGGWDCMRHYEILANGCIPYFIDLDDCPETNMHLLPKKLIKEAMNLPGVSYGKINHTIFDKKRYYKILAELLEYTRTHLSTRSMAQYLLDTIGYSGKGKILFLGLDADGDYLKTAILIGLKQINPAIVIDFPKVDLIYTNYQGNTKNMWGKGFTRTKVINDVSVDRTDIENRIKNKEFECIIYGYVHHGCMFHDTVTAHYPPEKIAYIDGEDLHRNCPLAHLQNFFLREYDAYSSLIDASPQAQDIRGSSYPFISGDTFRAIANHILDETNLSLDPNTVKPYDIIFLKTDYAPSFFEIMHPKITNPYILITHNSDLSPIFLLSNNCSSLKTDLSAYLDDPKLVVWFAQNIDYNHPKLIPIPIGLANSRWPHGNVELFLHAIQDIPPLEQRVPKIYLNFLVENNPMERQRALDILADLSFSHHAKFKSPAEYLKEMKCYRYIVNPPGNGFDCHRIWEALLIGCIPIIRHSPLDALYDGLPVIFVNDWTEINEYFLEQKYQQLKHQSYFLEKIYADYWINLIKNFH